MAPWLSGIMHDSSRRARQTAQDQGQQDTITTLIIHILGSSDWDLVVERDQLFSECHGLATKSISRKPLLLYRRIPVCLQYCFYTYLQWKGDFSKCSGFGRDQIYCLAPRPYSHVQCAGEMQSSVGSLWVPVARWWSFVFFTTFISYEKLSQGEDF